MKATNGEEWNARQHLNLKDMTAYVKARREPCGCVCRKSRLLSNAFTAGSISILFLYSCVWGYRVSRLPSLTFNGEPQTQ